MTDREALIQIIENAGISEKHIYNYKIIIQYNDYYTVFTFDNDGKCIKIVID
jgi:hypothetical protein